MNTTIEIIDGARPAIKRLRLAVDGGNAREEIGQAVTEQIQEHFRALPPNKAHFPSTGFWRRAAAATSYQVVSDGVRVSVNQIGVRQRLLGGRIYPSRGKFLTIPAIATTYGHRASEFADLKMCRISGSLAPALAPAELVRSGKGYVGPDSVYFFLRRYVTQQPDSTVFPEDAEITRTAMSALVAAATR